MSWCEEELLHQLDADASDAEPAAHYSAPNLTEPPASLASSASFAPAPPPHSDPAAAAAAAPPTATADMSCSAGSVAGSVGGGGGGGGHAPRLRESSLYRPYTIDARRGGYDLPFAPTSINEVVLAYEALSVYGAEQALVGGEMLCVQGSMNKDVFLVPHRGVRVEVTVDAAHHDGPLKLLTITHGAVFGVEGALLPVPSL